MGGFLNIAIKTSSYVAATTRNPPKSPFAKGGTNCNYSVLLRKKMCA
jgi:hypothetical protein